MKLKEYFAQLKVDLEPMTFPEKIDHIWTYNKELILIVVGVSILVIGLLITFLQKPDVVFCGFIVNTQLNDEGTNYLSTDYGNLIGVSGKQEVQLIPALFNMELNSAAEHNQATTLQITAYCQDGSLDYLMMDKHAAEKLVNADICYDLKTFFTEEELAQWNDKLLMMKRDDGTEIAYAVDISDTKFAKDCITNQSELYLTFISNTQHLDRCHEFWNYILSWK